MKPEPAGYGSLASQASNRESLSQAARKKQLHIARNILLVLGMLKIAVSAYSLGNIETRVNDEVNCQIRQSVQQGRQMTPAEIEYARNKARLIEFVVCAGAGSVGVIFVFLGLLLKKYPVPLTASSLLLYLFTTVLFGILNPLTLMEIFLFKFFVVAALIKSIHAAIAYERAESALVGAPIQALPAYPTVPIIRRTEQPISKANPPEAKPPSTELPTTLLVQNSPEYQQLIRAKAIPVEIYSKDSFSKGAFAFEIFGIFSLLIGLLNHNPHWSIFSLAPWMLAVVCWFFRPAPFRGELNASGLLMHGSSSVLPYANIHNLTFSRYLRSSARVDPFRHQRLMEITPLIITKMEYRKEGTPHMRYPVLTFFSLFFAGLLLADEPPVINPFGSAPNEREDAVPGYIELSDGTICAGQVYLTRDARLKINDEKLERQREVPLSAVKQIDGKVKKEWLEKEWKFKELTKDEKMYTGRTYPSREYVHTITLKDGRTIIGELSAIVYVDPPSHASPKPGEIRPQIPTEKFLLHKRNKGEIGQTLKSLVYVKSIKLGKEAFEEGLKKGRGERKKPEQS